MKLGGEFKGGFRGRREGLRCAGTHRSPSLLRVKTVNSLEGASRKTMI